MSASGMVAALQRSVSPRPAGVRPTVSVRVIARIVDVGLTLIVGWAVLNLVLQALEASEPNPWLLGAAVALLLAWLGVQVAFVLLRGHRLGGVLCGLTHADARSGGPQPQAVLTKTVLQCVAGVVTLGVGEMLASWFTLDPQTGQHVFDRWSGVRPVRAAVTSQRPVADQVSFDPLTPSLDEPTWRGPSPLRTRHEVGFIAASPFSGSAEPLAESSSVAHVLPLMSFPAAPEPQPEVPPASDVAPLESPDSADEVRPPELSPDAARGEDPEVGEDVDEYWDQDDLSYLPGFGSFEDPEELAELEADDVHQPQADVDDEPTAWSAEAVDGGSTMSSQANVDDSHVLSGPLPDEAVAGALPETEADEVAPDPTPPVPLAKVFSLHRAHPEPDVSSPGFPVAEAAVPPASEVAERPLVAEPAVSPTSAHLEATGELWTFSLNGGPTTALSQVWAVGRNPRIPAEVQDAQVLKVMDPHLQVSKTHLMIGPQDQGAWLMDMNSSNGTFISNNNRRYRIDPMERVPLTPGDVIEFGSHRIEVMN